MGLSEVKSAYGREFGRSDAAAARELATGHAAGAFGGLEGEAVRGAGEGVAGEGLVYRLPLEHGSASNRLILST